MRDDHYYLYIISCKTHFKIGITQNVESRINQMQTGNSVQLKLERAISFKSESYRPRIQEIEKAFHERFSTIRSAGEWFILKQEHLSEANTMIDGLIEHFDMECSVLDENGIKKEKELSEIEDFIINTHINELS